MAALREARLVSAFTHVAAMGFDAWEELVPRNRCGIANDAGRPANDRAVPDAPSVRDDRRRTGLRPHAPDRRPDAIGGDGPAWNVGRDAARSNCIRPMRPWQTTRV